MQDINRIWLASYPRSGNTFLRTILWQCFGLRSASIYPNDLGGNSRLEAYVGHFEYEPDKHACYPESGPLLVKTHEYPQDDHPAIYVIRDGRAACVSLRNFYKNSLSLEAVVEGQHQFGIWSNHVKSWNPWARPNTLLLEYENMINDLPATLNSISTFLAREIINEHLPERNTIAGVDDRKAISGVDGQWVTSQKCWRPELSGELLNRFNALNHDLLKKAGYLD
ncbi:MAG: sulfotransferase domain-containing protein [Methylomicrobium sp.]|nr:sulfotransferase domain-containing protein [Methylomicrobium sp.]